MTRATDRELDEEAWRAFDSYTSFVSIPQWFLGIREKARAEERERLILYTWHDSECVAWGAESRTDVRCTCGLTAALRGE